MKHSDKGTRALILTACLLLFLSLTGKAQQGLVLETAMEIAENNSPSIKKTTAEPCAQPGEPECPACCT